MLDRDALIAAIRAHPDEDTPRLMFADWLEEHDEPDRAAFIRLQCESHALEKELNEKRSYIRAAWLHPLAEQQKKALAEFDASYSAFTDMTVKELNFLRAHPKVGEELLCEMRLTHPYTAVHRAAGQIPQGGEAVLGFERQETFFQALAAHDGDYTREDPLVQNIMRHFRPLDPHEVEIEEGEALPDEILAQAYVDYSAMVNRGFIGKAALRESHTYDFIQAAPLSEQIERLNSTQEPVHALTIYALSGISAQDWAAINVPGITSLSLFDPSASSFAPLTRNPAFAKLQTLSIHSDTGSAANLNELLAGNFPQLTELCFWNHSFEAGTIRTLVDSGMCHNACIRISEDALISEDERMLVLDHNRRVELEKRQEQLPLLAAIRAEPDKDEPRLAYAQWLETTGQEVESRSGDAVHTDRLRESNAARAEFIRLQIERAKAEIDDPRRQECKAREDELLMKYGVGWARNDLGRFASLYSDDVRAIGLMGNKLSYALPPTNPDVMGRVPDVIFRRGFIDQMTIPADPTAGGYVPDLLKETTVTSFHFSRPIGDRFLGHTQTGGDIGDLNIDYHNNAEATISARRNVGDSAYPLQTIKPNTPQAYALLSKVQHLSMAGNDPKRLIGDLERYTELKPKTLELILFREKDADKLTAEYRRLLEMPNLKDTFIFLRRTAPGQGFNVDYTVPPELAKLRDEHNAALDESIQRDAAKYAVDKGVLPFAIPVTDGVQTEELVVGGDKALGKK